MQVLVESPTTVERRLTIVVPPSRVEQAFNSQLTVFAKKAEIKGFRRGKVPLTYVKQHYAKEIRSEALSQLIQESLSEAVHEKKLHPISAPRIETKATTSSLEYVATFEVLPELGPVALKLDSLEKPMATISDEDIDKTIERVREQHLIWTKVDRPAHDRDKINAKIQMFTEDGTPLTPEKVPLELVLKDEPSVFGWNLKEKLEGLKAGEEKKFNYTLPQEAFLQGMAGKTLEFSIEVADVSESELPPLSEDFIKKLGIESGNTQELRAEIRKQLELNLKRAEKQWLRDKVFEELRGQNPLDLPSSLIQREAKQLHDENCSAEHGQHAHSKEDEAYFLEVAKKRVHLGLLIGEFTSKNKISPSSKRIDEYLAELASVYTDADGYIQKIKSDQNAMKEVESAVLEDLLVEKLLENIKLVEKEVSYEELLKMK